MKAAILYEPGERLQIVDIPKPRLEENTAVVKVEAAGVCATELDFIEGIFPIKEGGIVPGHEIAGVIEEIDTKTRSSYKKGDRVAIWNIMNCGTCHTCRIGMENACPNRKGQLGFTHNGGFEEYVQVPVGSLVPLPKNVSFEEGAVLACSGLTAVHSSRIVGTKAGDRVIVNGVGGVGLLCIQVAKIYGAHVIAVADSQAKAKLAHQVGADDQIVVDDYISLGDKIRKLTAGLGVDIYYDLVGTSATYKAGVDCLGIGGRLVVIGYKKDENINFYPVDLLVKEGKVVTSVAGCKRDLELVLQFASQGRANPIIQNRFTLEKINDAIQLIIDRKVKGRSVIVN
jgi:propanol-preferring alcohol dehydrogenase